MLTTLAIANYRSLRELIVPLGALNVVTGPNGSGKSNLYRALRLLALTARGGVIPSLAREGGLQSTLWAGPERFSRAVAAGEYAVQGTVRKDVVSLRLGFAGDAFGYAIDLGLPLPSSTSQFSLDPVIKRECIWSGPLLRPSALLVDRQGPMIRIRDASSEWTTLAQPVASFDSMMTEYADPRGAPEMIAVREQIRSWRFYDHFRTDEHASARQVQIGTHSPVLADDGANLAAALQTIREIGDGEALDTAIGDAFPGVDQPFLDEATNELLIERELVADLLHDELLLEAAGAAQGREHHARHASARKLALEHVFAEDLRIHALRSVSGRPRTGPFDPDLPYTVRRNGGLALQRRDRARPRGRRRGHVLQAVGAPRRAPGRRVLAEVVPRLAERGVLGHLRQRRLRRFADGRLVALPA